MCNARPIASTRKRVIARTPDERCYKLNSPARSVLIVRTEYKELVVARDRAVMRGLAVGEVEHDFVDIAPAPAFRRVVAFDERVAGGVEMLGGMLVRGTVAAADMAMRAWPG